MKTAIRSLVPLLAFSVVLAACGGGGGGGGGAGSGSGGGGGGGAGGGGAGGGQGNGFAVTYDGNGATVGNLPVDPNNYAAGQTVTVLGNTGNLAYTGYSFVGWQTKADGSGTTYAPGQTFPMGTESVTLYALWSAGYAYATNQMGLNISQYTIGPNGALTSMTPATVPAGSEPISIAIAPSAKYAYVGTTRMAPYPSTRSARMGRSPQ